MMKITMKNGKFMLCMAVIAGAAAVLVIAACASGPRAPAEGYRQVRRGTVFVTSTYGIAPYYGEPTFGVTRDENGEDVYFMEHVKTGIKETPWQGSMDPIWLPDPWINARGYTRMSVEIMAENAADLLEDMDEFRCRLVGQNLCVWDYYRTDDWKAFRQKLIDEPGEFHTLEWTLGNSNVTTNGVDGNPLMDISQISLRFLTISDEDLPGRISFRNLRFYP